MWNILERLKPARWRRETTLAPKERHVLWKQVAPGDPCLRAIVDMLGEIVEQNAGLAMDMKLQPATRLAAIDAASVARGILFAIEDEWIDARQELTREINEAAKRKS